MTPKAAKLRALLALLLLRANEPVASDILIERLWDGKPPITAQNTLQHYISELRKLLPENTLVTQPPGYSFRVDPKQLDLSRFEQIAEEGRQALARGDPQHAADLLVRALGLWRGPALGDFAYESWAQQEAQRLEELRLGALEDRVEAQLALGRQGDLVAELQTLVADQPLRERLRGQLMLALYLSGRQADALQAYQEARRILVDELGVEPSRELRELEAAILRQEESLRVEADEGAPPSNLPVPPTPLIGRERELDEATALLASPNVRLLTMTGPGGIGKTRLGLALAQRVGNEFRDGAFLCELTPVREPLLALSSISQTLDVEETSSNSLLDDLKSALRERTLLLVLDNLEQVLDVGPSLAELLSSCAGLKLLVTSRAPLHLVAEHEYPVGPLSVSAAGQLFNERAQALRPDFSANGEVDEICERLDGLPLAIELAAARTRALSPAAILERLDQRLPLLTGGARDLPERQRTLRSTIAWSHELLTEGEQLLFARLSVFVGGCELESAEEVCHADLETVESLVEKSLLRQSGERFWMLETIREYALERFEESDEADTLRERHASHFLEFVEGRFPLMLGPEEQAAFERLSAEHDNLRSALRFTLDTGDVDTALRLAIGSLQRFWRIQGHLTEGRRWLEEALATGKGEARSRAMAFRALANLANQQGDPKAAIAAVDKALAFFRANGDVAEVIDCLIAFGGAMLGQGELDRARAYFEESEQLARGSGDSFRLAAAIGNRANVDLYEGAYDRALALAEESVELSRELELSETAAVSLTNAGFAALHLRLYERAAALLREGLEVSNSIGDSAGVVYASEGLAAILAAQSDGKRAVELLAAAGAIGESIDLELQPFEQQMHDRALEIARAGLSEEQFEAAWTAGKALTQAKLISHALSIDYLGTGTEHV